MSIPSALINKYNHPVPRYTSYPPANFFRDRFSSRSTAELLKDSNGQTPHNISLYIHIPFCSQLCFYCGCHTHISDNRHLIDRYLAALTKELEMVSKQLSPQRKVSQIHWGGGTPSLLPPHIIGSVMEEIFRNFTLSEQAELAMECHPANLSESYLIALREIGFNRISIGIQDFKQDVLKAVNRKIATWDFMQMIAFCKHEAKLAVNLDFIYGLPLQTVDSFLSTLEQAVKLSPDRLVTFSYAHLPQMKPHQKALEKHALPTPEMKLSMLKQGYDFLKRSGYVPIGIDHFARPDDELVKASEHRQLHRNFQGYCTRATTGQVYAVGSSGISQLANAYLQNTKSTEEYIQKINENTFPTVRGYILSEEKQFIQDVITTLMCNLYLSWEAISQKYQISIQEVKNQLRYSTEELKEFGKDGLLTFSDEELTITEQGKFFVRNIAAAFDPMHKENLKQFSLSV